jgi:hypothetical protein
MSKSRATSIVVSITISVTFAAFLVRSSVKGRSSKLQQTEQRVQQPERRTCLFMQSPEAIDSSAELSAAFKERMNRETHGYAQDVTMDEALKILNDELSCYSFWATLPPLNEREVIANAIGGPDYGGEAVWKSQEEAWKLIASKRMMPKGSLFVAESGGCEQAGPGSQRCVKGLKIYLFLGLDKKPRASSPLSREQIVLIRKTYFETETR